MSRHGSIGLVVVGVLVGAAALGGCADEPPEASAPTNNAAPNNQTGNNATNNGATNNTSVNNATPNNGTQGNRPPELGRIGDKRAKVGEALTFEVVASDPDGDELLFSVFGALPEGAKFDKGTRRFMWTPEADQLGALIIVTFAVSDGDLDARETIQIEVVEAGGGNSPPTLLDPGDQIAHVGEPFALRLQATDPDGDSLAWRIDGPSPGDSMLDKNSGIFTWVPTEADEGAAFQVLFVVSDGEDEDGRSVRLLVSELELVLEAIPLTEVRLNEELRLPLPIRNPAGLALTCSTLGEVPVGAAVDPTSCVFTWRPTDPTLVGRTLELVFRVQAEADGEPIALVGTGRFAVSQATAANNMTNNAAPECPADADEPNDSREAASSLTGPGATRAGQRLCIGDEDWYRIEAQAGDAVEVDLTFLHAGGDLDLAVYAGEERQPLRTGSTVTDNERVRIEEAPVSGPYFIRVHGFHDSANAYDLSVRVSAGQSCADDADEPDDSPSEATPIEAGHSALHTICAEDDDWYEVDVPAGASLRAAIVLDSDEYDLDLRVHGPGNRTWRSEGVTALEEIVIAQVPEGGVYLIEVDGFLSDAGPYALEAEVTQPCAPDLLEPNDSSSEALPLLADDELSELRACGEGDWFAYALPAGVVLYAVLDGPGVTSLPFEVRAEDGVEVLAAAVDAGDFVEVEAGPFEVDRDLFLVVGGGDGQVYTLGVVALP